jgi:hypothetical protein
MTPDTIEKIKNAYNQEHPSSKIKSNNADTVFKTLKKKYLCKSGVQDACWISTIGNKNLQREIKKKIFVPEKPAEWKKKPNEWLSNFDILNVLKQYEEAYSFFRFIGPTPIDFDKRLGNVCVTQDLCSFHLNIQKHSQIGIIFNLDEHDEPGSHWVSMYIDIDDKKIYYFDSASTEIPKEIVVLKDRLIQENPEFTFLSNSTEHQRGNTECGMYSLFFIVQMLMSKNRPSLFQTRFNNERKKITDKTVEEYRDIYFN